MKQSPRKTSSPLHLAYRYGEGSNRLVGRQFTLINNDHLRPLSIDLTPNFHTRAKAAASYGDAIHLLQKLDVEQELEEDIRAIRSPAPGQPDITGSRP